MSEKKRVLIIEDDELLRTSLQFFLSSKSYEVLEAENGFQAIEILAKNTVSAIVTDLNMPNMSGTAFIKHLRETMKLDVPILVLTSMGNERSELESFHLGANDFIAKPFDVDFLLNSIKKNLQSAG